VIEAVTVLFILSASLYVMLPWLYGRLLRRKLHKKAATTRTVVISFDDGPGTCLTLEVLERLAEHQLRASFFLLGRNIPGREEIVRRIRDEGHDVCSHGFDHLHAWKVWPWQAISDIRKGWQTIDKALGTGPGRYPFRPAYGKLNLVTLLYLWAKRVPIVYWSVDIGDTWSPARGQRERDREWEKLRQGGVVLAHDFDRTTDHIDAYVLESVDRVLNTAEDARLTVRSLSELGVVKGGAKV